MNKKLTILGIVALAVICAAISLVTAIVTYGVALFFVWALSKPEGVAAYLVASFAILFIATIIKVAEREEDA